MLLVWLSLLVFVGNLFCVSPTTNNVSFYDTGGVTVQVSPQESADDSEEGVNSGKAGFTYLDSSDLELNIDAGNGFMSGVHQLVGIRFPATSIPTAAVVTRATLKLTSKSPTPSSSSQMTYLIKAQMSTGCSVFSGNEILTSDISSRALTTASASWTAGPWASGTQYESTDFSSVIQEVRSF